jgi:hypothetical protein
MTSDLDKLLDEARGPESADERFARTGGTGRPAEGQEDPELLAERRAFYATHPWPSVERALEERRARRGFDRIRFWFEGFAWFRAGLVAATVFAVAGAVTLLDESRTAVIDRPMVRTKGTVTPSAKALPRDEDVSLAIHRVGGSRGDVDGLRPGEAVYFTYTSLDLPWLVLGSVDERGNVSIYYPESAEQSLSVVPGRDVRLPDGVILDEYVGEERFFAVFSAEPVAVEDVRRAASSALGAAGGVARTGRLALDETAQASFTIRKVAD